MVKLENVNKYFNRNKNNEIHVIDDTTLEFGETGLVALLGASGSGKTTLLNTIGGLDKVTKGEIYINGERITKRSTYSVDKIRNLNIGYIFQDYKLIDNLTVYENVELTLKMLGIKDKNEIKKRINYVLECVNMYRYRDRPTKMLSGGERQRVSIARAIVKNPDIVIADEPTGNLDSKNSLEIMNIIKAISKDKLVILVTHEVELAKFYASRIIEIQDGKVINDYENDAKDLLDYRLDNKIYLKDIESLEKINTKYFKLHIYSDTDEKANIRMVIKDGNIYIQSENKKVEIVDENSAVELIDGKYRRINKKVYQEYDYKLNKMIDKNIKTKYSSIYGIVKSIINGFKKIASYSIPKKILLAGFFASAMFIMYSVCNIAGTLNIKDSDFITRNKNYLEVEMARLNVDDFKKYEELEEVNYILPGDSMVSFKINFDDYYQTSQYSFELSGSLTALDDITEEDIINGKMPENEYEILVDKMVIDNMKNGSSNMVRHMGITSEEELLNKEVYIDNMNEFKIVGFVNKNSPCIYTNKSMIVNVLNNSKSSDTSLGMYFPNNYTEEEEKVQDYNLYLDDITLTKGRKPTEDYEVIVNKSKQEEMKLNKTIDTKVNGVELKVVGYYDSKTDRQDYLVNNNTVKYDLINKKEGMMIYPKDEIGALNKLKGEYNLNIRNRYEKDKEEYIKNQKQKMVSSIISAGIILAISLVEIYLMIRSSFLSRIKEVGVLRAIGVKKADIYRMFFGEILVITTISSMPGIVLMRAILGAMLKAPYVDRLFIVNSGAILISALLVYGFNIIVGLMPLFSILRKTPAKILARHDLE